jgi:hypothetical protein
LDWRNVRKNVSCRHHLKSWLNLWPRLFEFMDFSIAIFIWISLVDPPHKNSLFRAWLSALAAGCVFEGVAFVSQLKNSPDVSSYLVAKRGDWPWWEVLERKKENAVTLCKWVGKEARSCDTMTASAGLVLRGSVDETKINRWVKRILLFFVSFFRGRPVQDLRIRAWISVTLVFRLPQLPREQLVLFQTELGGLKGRICCTNRKKKTAVKICVPPSWKTDWWWLNES